MAPVLGKNLDEGIILLSKPNKTVMERRTDWISDNDNDTGMIILEQNITLNRQGEGGEIAL